MDRSLSHSTMRCHPVMVYDQLASARGKSPTVSHQTKMLKHIKWLNPAMVIYLALSNNLLHALDHRPPHQVSSGKVLSFHKNIKGPLLPYICLFCLSSGTLVSYLHSVL